MTTVDPSESKQVVAELVSAAMRELLDSMSALCRRLQDYSAPFCEDEYDRLGLLLPSMLGAAEELCRAADSLLVDSDPVALHGANIRTPYGDLAQALVETKHLAKRLLEPLRPQIQEHADAIALINRVSSNSASVRGKPS